MDAMPSIPLQIILLQLNDLEGLGNNRNSVTRIQCQLPCSSNTSFQSETTILILVVPCLQILSCHSMEFRCLPTALLLLLLQLAVTANIWRLIGFCSAINRQDFPDGFIFGAGTSAFQVEGAANVDGRKPSIWDVYVHQGNMVDGSNADISADQYHHYKEDVRRMKEMGLDAYRFSISWSRLIPDGRGKINPKGLAYYNSLIDELIAQGIQPHVSLFHFDTPLSLETGYGSWLQPNIIDDFAAYAEVCFKEFGDRVKHWVTMNEVNVIGWLGYDVGWFPPQRCSRLFGNCSAGNSSVEPYIVGHHLLLAHAKAASIYTRNFQRTQRGIIGISYFALWFEPLSNSYQDSKAARRGLDFFLGLMLDPVVFGDYPAVVKQRVGSRLPRFTKKQSQIVKNSCDFIGIMHYTTLYVTASEPDLQPRDFFRDMAVTMLVERNGVPIGKIADTGLPVVPWGMQALLEYLKQHYNNPSIIIYENGYGMRSQSLEKAVQDEARIEFLSRYLENMLSAIRNGSNTVGYFVWSLMDVFEFFYGYSIKYGLWYIDFNDPSRTRYPKQSALWYSSFLKAGHNYEHQVANLPLPLIAST